MSFSVGSLVTARGREWVVLPESTDALLRLQPLGGATFEQAGVLTALEDVRPATFPMPGRADLGDFRSARMLRDALRIGFRSSAGPFRCFGSLSFDPRPYQLVPLLMALRLDPVRLLVADDVGTGKTASTLLVAAELLAQGDVSRLAVLCPPHLAAQWQGEMRTKFSLEAELVLSATAPRLERGCATGETLFDRHDVTVVSTEYIKAERRRAEFLRSAPELIIVDEAHTCAAGRAADRGRHQRHELVAALAADPDRHVVLVTATPHSGDEAAFRSLLALLDPALGDLPVDLSGDANQGARRRLARHFVQRRRGDLKRFLGDTPFPDRHATEATYELSPAYRRLFDRVLDYAADSVAAPGAGAAGAGAVDHRVRWWSALALLRALASSPAAAATTLRRRARNAESPDPGTADDIGRQLVLDLADDDDTEPSDLELGSTGESRVLADLARLADDCRGNDDTKAMRLTRIVAELLDEGFHPIVFCRFIATADYVAEQLSLHLAHTEVRAVSGRIPSSERPGVVEELMDTDRRVLVATDCLAEGINLQAGFDAVVHYDLSWNPTRHEQREGRVDRFGQPLPTVRVVTYFGSDNRIDQLVLDVLLRKHQAIRTSLGISVPVPGDPNAIMEALVHGLFDRGRRLRDERQLVFEGLDREERRILEDWDTVAERERRSRTVFAQESIRAEDVDRELRATNDALGTAGDLRRFVVDSVRAVGGSASGAESLRVALDEAPEPVRDAAGGATQLVLMEPAPSIGITLAPETGRGARQLQRGDSFVRDLAAYVMDAALDPRTPGPARRAGVLRTDAVRVVTTLFLVRHRFDLTAQRPSGMAALLAEDAGVAAFTGLPFAPEWLDTSVAEALLDVTPSANVSPQQAAEFLGGVLDARDQWEPGLSDLARRRAGELLDAHRRVREAVGRRSASYAVEPRLPSDVLGLYVLLPGPRR